MSEKNCDVTFFWDRTPGVFVVKETGDVLTLPESMPQPSTWFAGTVREWYETLIETVIDCATTLHRQAAKDGGNCKTASLVANVGGIAFIILQASILYHPMDDVSGNVAHIDVQLDNGMPSNDIELTATYDNGVQLSGLVKILGSL